MSIHGFIASSMAGILLGLGFYACVRMRMYAGPKLRERYGNWARQLYWLLTILLMVAIANVALIGLRGYLYNQTSASSTLLSEIWFVLVAVALAFLFIYRRVNRKK